jgi:hypothetical protein
LGKKHAEKHTPYDNIVSRYELLCKASSLLAAGQFESAVIPKRGFIARRTCWLPANSRLLTGLSARFGMTK